MTTSKKGNKAVRFNWEATQESFKAATPATRLEMLSQLCAASSEDCLRKSTTFQMQSNEASFLMGMKTAFDTMSSILNDAPGNKYLS